jgi:hypothetical protein
MDTISHARKDSRRFEPTHHDRHDDPTCDDAGDGPARDQDDERTQPLEAVR